MSDICIIGGGIVGLATAHAISKRNSDVRLSVVEKESSPALHQSGRNSGVLHTGIYYKPGSMKATTCRLGKLALQDFCLENDVNFELCGKIIVATSDSELPRLQGILNRGIENGVKCRRIDAKELQEIEPYARGLAAIHVPDTGIIDYRSVCKALVRQLTNAGHEVRFGFDVQEIHQKKSDVHLKSKGDSIIAKHVVNCAGLYSDHIVRLAGGKPTHRIVPFRGEYYELRPEFRFLCRNLIYPVPDPSFPFLGVHLTRMVDDSVECGPNAVLALAREGYSWRIVSIAELFDSVSYPGLQRLALKHWRMGAGEVWRSISKSAFVGALQKLVPQIKPEHVSRGRAGVRAQAVRADGRLADDFEIQSDERITHVINAPSPAATASLQIGHHIAQVIEKTLR